MIWPFGRRKRKVRKARQEYRQASAQLRQASRRWSLFGRRKRAMRRAAKQYEQAQVKLRKLGVLEESGTYPRNWGSLRHNVYARDRHRCTMCGRKGGRKVALHAHHIVPLSRGGTNTLDNLTTLCSACHRRVHARRST
jgi:5-methylcytosine-specific restriction endonuclease McrA